MKIEKENNLNTTDNEISKPGGLKKITPFISLYNDITEGYLENLAPEQRKAAIALAVMTDDPKNLRHLSDLWQTPHEQLLVSIRDGYYDQQVKQVGFEIFDRKKAQEKAKDIPIAERVDKMFSSLPPTLLTEHQQEILNYVNQGMTNEQIGNLLGIKRQSVAVLLVEIRKKIDPFIQKAGLMRLGSFHTNALKNAAGHGTLDAEKILRIYHTTPDKAKRYIKKVRHIDQNLLDQGYILLSDKSQISKTEYHNLLGERYRDDILRKNDRAYVSKEFLRKFRTEKIKRKSYLKPPPGKKSLIDCIPLPPDHPDRRYIYQKMLYRVKKGWIASSQVQRKWFVVEEDVLSEINSLIERRSATRQS